MSFNKCRKTALKLLRDKRRLLPANNLRIKFKPGWSEGSCGAFIGILINGSKMATLCEAQN